MAETTNNTKRNVLVQTIKRKYTGFSPRTEDLVSTIVVLLLLNDGSEKRTDTDRTCELGFVK